MAEKKRIIFVDAGPEVDVVFADSDHRQRIEELGAFEICYGDPGTDEEYLKRAQHADAILIGGPAPFPVDIMRQTKALEVISFTGRGVDTYVDLAAATAQGITVCNAPGALELTVAEHALALMLACTRHLPLLDREVRTGVWNQGLPAIELQGKVLGLLGCGPIAVHFARLASGIGMKVRAWTRNPSAERADRDCVEFAAFDEIVRESDVLSMHVAHTGETEGILGTDELARTKRGVVVLNTARGALIDYDALTQLLQSSHIAAAGLDVFSEEPPALSHPLLQLENVVLSPHVAWNTPEATGRVYDIAIDNLVGFYHDKPVNVVAGPTLR